MTYHMNKLGDWPADAVWNPGPGQLPRNDPRVVKQYARVRGQWTPSAIPSTAAASAPNFLKQKVQARLPGWTVDLTGNGWVSGGVIELSVVVPSDTPAGRIKGAFFDAGQDYGEDYRRPGAKGQLVNPVTFVNTSDIKIPTAAPTPTPTPSTPGTPTPAAPPDTSLPVTTDTTSQPFFSRTIAGLPVWAIGAGGVAIVGTLAFMALKKPAARSAPAAVVANRRRRSRRRS